MGFHNSEGCPGPKCWVQFLSIFSFCYLNKIGMSVEIKIILHENENDKLACK